MSGVVSTVDISELVPEPKKRAMSIVGTNDDGGRPDDDFYPTPVDAVEGLLKFETFEGFIGEPACGDGAICKVLQTHGYKTVASDLNDHGYGIKGVDFLKMEGVEFDNIVTNPPFGIGNEFVHQALKLTKPGGKVAILHKLAFLEGVTRKEEIFGPTPPARVLVFSYRLKLGRDGKRYKNGGMMAFAWYVWIKGNYGDTIIKWI